MVQVLERRVELPSSFVQAAAAAGVAGPEVDVVHVGRQPVGHARRQLHTDTHTRGLSAPFTQKHAASCIMTSNLCTFRAASAELPPLCESVSRACVPDIQRQTTMRAIL